VKLLLYLDVVVLTTILSRANTS